jgi:tetratricopeptide (TPR) repeat protein
MRLCYIAVILSISNLAFGQSTSLLVEAKKLYDEEKYREALTLLDKALTSTNDEFDIWLIRGNCLQKDEKFVAAIQAYERAERIDAQSAVLSTNQGAAYLNLKQPEEAEKLLKKALKIDETHPDAHYFMGNLRYFEFNVSAALKHYNEAIKLKPNYRDALYMRAASNAELGKYRDALRDYEAVLEIDPELAAAKYNMAVIYLQADQYSKAAEILENIDATKLDKPADYYYHIAEAQYFAGNKVDACANYAMAAELGDVESRENHLRYCVDKQEREAKRTTRTIRASF